MPGKLNNVHFDVSGGHAQPCALVLDRVYGLHAPCLDLKGAYTYDAAMVALAYAIPGDPMADTLEPAKLVDIDMDWLA